MKTKEIREIETADLQEQVASLQAKLEQMKLNHAVSPLENPMQIRQTRRDIARMKTILRERELNK
jgi:large subunit ribosomal protein L29